MTKRKEDLQLAQTNKKQKPNPKETKTPYDSDDDKPLMQPKPKAKAKAKTEPKPKPNKPMAMSQSKRPEMRAAKRESIKREEREDEPPQAAKPNKKQKRAPKNEQRKDGEGVVAIQETPLPKAKKRAKNAPASEKEEAALDIIRASKKANAATGKGKNIPRLPADKKKAQEFYIGDPVLDVTRPPKNLRRVR